MLKVLFYTAVHVSELVRIEVSDVDLKHNKIFIDRGKGSKDRYILFPAAFRLMLTAISMVTPTIIIFRNAAVRAVHAQARSTNRADVPAHGGN